MVRVSARFSISRFDIELPKREVPSPFLCCSKTKYEANSKADQIKRPLYIVMKFKQVWDPMIWHQNLSKLWEHSQDTMKQLHYL